MRRSKQAGSTMVETAFVLVPFFMLLLGIIDVSLTVFLRSTLQNAVNQGVKYAASAQVFPGKCHEESVRKVVQDNALGFLSGTKANTIAVNYYSSADLSQPITGPAGSEPGNVVEVAVKNYDWNLLILNKFASGAGFSAFAADRLENSGDSSSVLCR